MGAVLALADQIAGSEASILVTGESGTGKEVLARYVHRNRPAPTSPSSRSIAPPFRKICWNRNRSASEKGAFTGAIARRIGKFEEANGGTAAGRNQRADARLQAKLPRAAIQERENDRVGGTKPAGRRYPHHRHFQPRPGPKRSSTAIFREDLRNRLNVVNPRLSGPARAAQGYPRPRPSLRPQIRCRGETARSIARPPPPTERLLVGCRHRRGNVRELENTIRPRRAAGEWCRNLPGSHPPARRHPGRPCRPLRPCRRTVSVQSAVVNANGRDRGLVGRTVFVDERDSILDTLDHCLGNRTHGENNRGISIRTLRNKLREHS